MIARMKMVTLVAALTGVAGPAFAGEKVTIAVPDSPYYTPTGGGLAGEILVDAFRRAGVEVALSVLPIKRGVQALFAGEVDAHSPGALFITGDLQEKIEWVNYGKVVRAYAYYLPVTPQHVLPQDPAERARYLKDRGLSVGVLQNSPSAAPLRAQGITVHECLDDVQLLRMLKAGRFQYAISDVYSLATTLAATFPKEKTQFAMILGEPLIASVAFVKGTARSAGLEARFEQGLAAMMKDGSFLALNEKYFGRGNVPAAILPPELAAQGTKAFDLAKLPLP